MAGTPERIDFVTGAPTAGSWEVTWRHGTPRRRPVEPPIQLHHIDDHTVMLRQSKQTHYEAPFVFLLFGNDRALLLDTGATADPARFPLRATIDNLVAAWLTRHPRESYDLVVAHTHGHGDHVAADGQFADRPATTVVGREPEAVAAYFGFDPDWPTGTVAFDLGGRVLDVIGSPGHHPSAITIYDPWTATLFTGDTVLPGRLYAVDYPAFLATLDRLVAFTATHTVRQVVGCHVEMTDRPGRDYPLGARYQPRERDPRMTAAQLVAVRDAATSVAGKRGVYIFDDFIVYHEPRRRHLLRLVGRGLAHKVRAVLVPARR
jgi:glyoxylase-like metal-dependent hydrolase (beta-lactamase superfamily II)